MVSHGGSPALSAGHRLCGCFKECSIDGRENGVRGALRLRPTVTAAGTDTRPRPKHDNNTENGSAHVGTHKMNIGSPYSATNSLTV